MVFQEVFVNVILALWQSLFPVQVDPLPYATFEPPGSKTVGLVRDEARERWWATDEDDQGLGGIFYRTDSADTWISVLSEDDPLIGSGDFGPIAIDGTTLWVVVEQAGTAFIEILDTSEHQVIRLRPRFEIPPAARRLDPSITGLTYDGESLWMVTGCGLCSTLYKINPGTGEEMLSFFPACSPRGIAFRRHSPFNRGQLWIIAYNGPKKRPLLSKRKIAWNPSALNTSQEFYVFKHEENKGPPEDPTAIAARAEYLWVVDRKSKSVNRYTPGNVP